jgi:hypothetical protein
MFQFLTIRNVIIAEEFLYLVFQCFGSICVIR